MSRTTAALYTDLASVAPATEYVVQRSGASFVVTATELMEALIPVPPASIPSIPPTSTPSWKVVVATDSLNVRSGPGTTYTPPLRQVTTDTVLTIAEQRGDWLRIDGKTEWVSGIYTRPYPTSPPPVIVIAPSPVTSVGGYGRHYLGAPSVTELDTDHYLIAKAVDQPEALQRLHARNPNAMYIYRHFLDFDEQDRRLRLMASDMQGALNQWFTEMESSLIAMPYAYFESLNEVDALPQFVEFERLRTLRLTQRGIKSCVLNLSVGHSDAAMWSRCHALIDAVIAGGGVVGEHSYGMGLISNNAGDSYIDRNGNWHGEMFPVVTAGDIDNCHTGLRIMKSRKILAAQGQPQARLVATELGLGNTADVEKGRPGLLNTITEGWRDCIPLWRRCGWLIGTTPNEFYTKQLKWWADTTGCLGTAYTFGTGGNSKWNVDNVQGVL